MKWEKKFPRLIVCLPLYLDTVLIFSSLLFLVSEDTSNKQRPLFVLLYMSMVEVNAGCLLF